MTTVNAKLGLLMPFLLLFMLLNQSMMAQKEYVHAYHKHILLKGMLNNRSLNFDVSPRKSDSFESSAIRYRPDVQNTLGFGVNFKHVGLSMRFKLSPHPSAKVGEKGKVNTSYFDLQFHSFGKKIGYDVYYQKYKGYFIKDAEDIFNSSQNGVRLPKRDDLRLYNFNANFFVNFNPEKFSYRATFVHDEKQLRSAGAFILTGSAGFFRAGADSSFIPPNSKFGFRPESFFSETEFYTIAVTPGYAHTIVLPKNFYISASLSGLVGLQYYKGSSKKVHDEGFDHYLKGIFRAGLGYNSEKWVVGTTFSSDIRNLNTDFVRYRTVNLETSVFIVHRIQTNFMKEYNSFFDLLKRKKSK